MSDKSNLKPQINVTPLIDVLLVLLIIFMVISPLKPSAFEAKLPSPPIPDNQPSPNPHTIVVRVGSDSSLEINGEKDFGTVADPSALITRLSQVFSEREANGVFRDNTNEIEKTVFIKAPKSFPYGQVAKAVDAVKISGAAPIGLQIDNLD